MSVNLDAYFKNGLVYVWKETFAILKTKKPLPSAFATIIDKDEITVVADQSSLDKSFVLESDGDWKLFTLDIVFPKTVYGVTAKIASAMAAQHISIMPLAAFSRDHFLIKKKDEEKAITVFKSLGLHVKNL